MATAERGQAGRRGIVAGVAIAACVTVAFVVGGLRQQRDETVAVTEDNAGRRGGAAELGAPDEGAAVVVSPSFDIVRIDPDGGALVAGRAAPGAAVSVLLDDMRVAQVPTDASGAFVAFLDLPPAEAPRVLSLIAGEGADGVVSAQTAIVGPVATAGGRTGAVVAAEPPDLALPVAAKPPTPPAVGAAAQAEPRGVGSGAPDAPSVAAAVVVTPNPTPIPSSGGPRSEAIMAEPTVPAEVPEAAADPEAAPVPQGGITAPVVEGPRSAPPTAPDPLAAEPAAGRAADLSVPPPESAPVAVAPPVVIDAAPSLTGPVESSSPTPVLIAEEGRVRVLQPAPTPAAEPEAPRTVALDTIAYDAGGDVVLGGRAAGGGGVRLYLDNRDVGDVAVGADGTWTADLTGVTPGTYTLRVDQVAEDGSVVSRIETPFLREDRGTIAAVLDEEVGPGGVAVRTVQPGNTLWGISQDRYGEGVLYVRVFAANRDLIRDPNLIYPGQILRLPGDD